MRSRKRKPSLQRSGRTPRERERAPVGLRIIGGRFRGRKLLAGGDPRLRPMKHRVREAVFNLIGPSVRDKHALDLFAGSGALALEAISRGATGATLVEQHFPTAAIIRRNVATLGVEQITRIVTANVFLWRKRQPDLPTTPWVVFCSPPWDFFVKRRDELLGLIGDLLRWAPADSIFAVEADERFDFGLLPDAEAWQVRGYRPAVVGIFRVGTGLSRNCGGG